MRSFLVIIANIILVKIYNVNVDKKYDLWYNNHSMIY